MPTMAITNAAFGHDLPETSSAFLHPCADPPMIGSSWVRNYLPWSPTYQLTESVANYRNPITDVRLMAANNRWPMTRLSRLPPVNPLWTSRGSSAASLARTPRIAGNI